MPRKPESGWQVDEDTLAQYATRIGNLVLLRKADNSMLRSKPFEEKVETYKRSGYELTKMVAGESRWTPQAIENRQMTLADLALRAWPIKPPPKPQRPPKAKRSRRQPEDINEIAHRTMRKATGT